MTTSAHWGAIGYDDTVKAGQVRAGAGESADDHDGVVAIGPDEAWAWRPTEAKPVEAPEGEGP